MIEMCFTARNTEINYKTTIEKAMREFDQLLLAVAV